MQWNQSIPLFRKRLDLEVIFNIDMYQIIMILNKITYQLITHTNITILIRNKTRITTKYKLKSTVK